jgi:hypothetical protein
MSRQSQCEFSDVRLTSYNILSSSLADADYYCYSERECVSKEYRLKKIKEKLLPEIEQGIDSDLKFSLGPHLPLILPFILYV